MKILYLSSKPAFPTVDGGCRAMAEILECFALNEWEVEQLVISTEKHPFRKDAYPEHLSNIESVFISTAIKPLPALIALLSGKNYNISRFNTEEFKVALINKIKSTNFDIIFMDGLFVTTYLKLCRKHSKSTIVIRTHNVEHQIWQRVASNAVGKLKRWYLSSLSKSLKQYEIETLNHADLVLSITEEDKHEFQNEGVRIPIVHIPFSLPEIEFDNPYSKTDFFFLGSMNWEPNKETVKAITTRIFPAIRKELPDAKLFLAGSFMENKFLQKNEGIHVEGFVHDPIDFFKGMGIFLCPIYSGSGVRIKIMEAMSVGTPVITTKLGAMGIPDSSENLIIAETDQEVVHQAIHLFKEQKLRQEFGKKAALCIKEEFGRKTVAIKLKNVLESHQA